MAGFFYNLGRSFRSSLHKGKWMLNAATGSEADTIRAEAEVGRDMARAILEKMPLDPDPHAADLLASVGARLASRVRNRQRRFFFRTLLTPERNAFALPGGHVFITRALLDLCAWDPDETAFILAHEMAHVLRGHAMERIMNAWMLTAARRALPLGGLAGAWIFQQASELVHRAYSRDQELDADMLGVQLAHSGGYDPHAAPRVLRRLQTSAVPDSPFDGYFATHPPFPERLANLNKYLKG